jgi:hypothetical protein
MTRGKKKESRLSLSTRDISLVLKLKYIYCFWSAISSKDFKPNLLALVKSFETFILNSREMHEYIRTAVCSNSAVAFFFNQQKPLFSF